MDPEADARDARRLRPGLVAPVRVDPIGRTGPTRRSAAGGLWRRSSRGRYVPSSVEASLDQRIVEAAVVLPEHGGVTGWAALAWRRARWFDGEGAGGRQRPVTLVTAGDDIRVQPGIAVSAERLDPRDLEWVDGVRVTSSVRSTWFEMRYVENRRLAVVALDMAAYDDLVSLDEMAEWEYLHPGWTGAPQCRWALGYASENSWSPRETLTHLVWQIDADLPRLLCNCPLFDRSGNHIGTPTCWTSRRDSSCSTRGSSTSSAPHERATYGPRRSTVGTASSASRSSAPTSPTRVRWRTASTCRAGERRSRLSPPGLDDRAPVLVDTDPLCCPSPVSG